MAGQLYHGAQGFANSMFGQQTPVANSTPEYQQALANVDAANKAGIQGDKLRAADAVAQPAVKEDRSATDAWNDANVKKLNAESASREEASRLGIKAKEHASDPDVIRAKGLRDMNRWINKQTGGHRPNVQEYAALANVYHTGSSNAGGMTPAQVQAQANHNETMQFQREGRDLAQDERKQTNDEQKAKVKKDDQAAAFKAIDAFGRDYEGGMNLKTGEVENGLQQSIQKKNTHVYGDNPIQADADTAAAYRASLLNLGVSEEYLNNAGIRLKASDPKIVELFDPITKEVRYSGTYTGALKKAWKHYNSRGDN